VTIIEYTILALVLCLMLPVCAYLCMKLGTYGYLKARDRFYRDIEREDTHG
jgi:hypothetical protein